MPSVSWISPPAPGLVARSASKMSGVSTYRPMMARSLGASDALGFSTTALSRCTRPCDSATAAHP